MSSADYNKIITTVNSVTPDYSFIPNQNDVIVIDNLVKGKKKKFRNSSS